jgi:endonuclease G
MKNKYTYLLIAFVAIMTMNGCKKDSFDPTPENVPIILEPVVPPQDLPDSNLVMGNPSSATTDVNNFNNYLMKEGYYTVSYDRDRAIPNWVSWHLTASDLGTTPRQDDFRSNNNLPDGWYHVENFSYNGGGFDRGHMCPSADRTATVPANSSTFLMTNIVPQAPVNNQVTWAALEDYARSLVGQGNELYTICGSYGVGGVGNAGPFDNINNGQVTVPAMLWKVIVVLPNGADDVTRVSNSTRVISVIMPNTNTVNSNWRTLRTTVDAIEAATGYDILSKVDPAIQAVIEARVDNL